MYLIQQITSYPYQTQTLILPNGNSLTLTIRFAPMQYGWFITNLTYFDFVLNGMRICNSPNMLYQFKNNLPFGLACYSTQNREPSLQQDFSSGASSLYILNADEVEGIAELYSNG